MTQYFLLVFLILSNLSLAEIRVAFFECYTWQGELIQFEKEGRFCHVAISYRDGWVHAHPVYGVEYRKYLNEIRIGKLAKVLSDYEIEPLPESLVRPWIGLPYDNQFHWKTTKKTYCSKLVGNFLEVLPKIMTFDTPYWQKFQNLPENELGISPDGIFRELISRNYVVEYTSLNPKP